MKALVISNGIGSVSAYPDRDDMKFDVAPVSADFALTLDDYDLLIAPNGTDHVALYRQRHAIHEFLTAGKSVFCFCGWFLDWIPGNRWVHDNSLPTKDMRHFAGDDPDQLLAGVDLSMLDHNRHGISGWWACGYIEPAPGANVLVKDTWGRAVIVADQATTPGFLFLTASGPVGDYSRYGYGESPASRLYENAISLVRKRCEVAIAKN